MNWNLYDFFSNVAECLIFGDLDEAVIPQRWTLFCKSRPDENRPPCDLINLSSQMTTASFSSTAGVSQLLCSFH